MENNSLTNSIRSNMQAKETEVLIEIWHNRDQEEYSPTALEIVKEILLERLGEIPSQEPEETQSYSDGNGDEEPLHNADKFMNISVWASFLSWVILAMYMISFLCSIFVEIQILIHNMDPFQNFSSLSVLSAPVLGFMYFLILQAISQGILFLLDLDDKLEKILGMQRK